VLSGLRLATALAIATLGACRSRSAESTPGEAPSRSAAESANAARAGGGREPEPVRLARGALHGAKVPLYPGADGLDATEFEKNKLPFIAVDFFTLDPPDRVVAFYDREIEALVTRRDMTREPGTVRYEFKHQLAGLSVKPWTPAGGDSSAMLARFDRRDALGVSTEELDHYGKLLQQARTHVVVNLPRPEPAGATP
jgi:hypothetical protein